MLGVSRRIKAIPRNFKVGETRILLAHPKTVPHQCKTCNGMGMGIEGEAEGCESCDGKGSILLPGIFKVWRPSHVEKLLPESKRDSDEVKQLVEQGITPIFVPDNDPDHRGTVYDKDEEEADDEIRTGSTITDIVDQVDRVRNAAAAAAN